MKVCVLEVVIITCVLHALVKTDYVFTALRRDSSQFEADLPSIESNLTAHVRLRRQLFQPCGNDKGLRLAYCNDYNVEVTHVYV
ncbi:hypothetical protein OUZ56_017627 [Daphnia magna]|uniref:Secreted protein n=1 Tax=Daphnia magna TaxID=35525 RepID=A0ABR0AT97_9CRUS|nr:hypothetical protein OUZ56_017627 [Daphnia magna]